ncbi:MAG: hypothetical protein HC765_07775 [Brachymonas sp.]|nr:hypothetical protein [Brachymonas sp.]
MAATSGASGLEFIASSNNSEQLPSDTAGLAKWVVARYGSKRETALAFEEFPAEPCPAGGSLSGSTNYSSDGDPLVAGDTITLNFTNCIFELGDPSVNGGISLTFNSVTYSGAEISSASLTMRFTSFSSYGNVVNGAATVALNSTSTSVAYSNFSSTRGSTPAIILNYTAVFTNDGDLNINGLISLNNNTYTLSTPVSIITGSSSYPILGTLSVTDASGGRIDIVSSSTSGGFVDCDLYLPGDNISDGRISSAWSAL